MAGLSAEQITGYNRCSYQALLLVNYLNLRASIVNIIKNTVVVKLSLLLVAAVLSLSAYAISDKNRAAIEERTSPIAKVCLEGDDSCGVTVVAAATEPKSAEEVYKACGACHDSGAAGAPKMGDVVAWAPRIEQGMDTLYMSVINGLNAMPAKGLCMTCSDEDIKVTVDYMVANSQ